MIKRYDWSTEDHGMRELGPDDRGGYVRWEDVKDIVEIFHPPSNKKHHKGCSCPQCDVGYGNW